MASRSSITASTTRSQLERSVGFGRDPDPVRPPALDLRAVGLGALLGPPGRGVASGQQPHLAERAAQAARAQPIVPLPATAGRLYPSEPVTHGGSYHARRDRAGRAEGYPLNMAQSERRHGPTTAATGMAATFVIAVMMLGAVSMWTVIPFGWIWIGSRLSTTQTPSGGPYMVVFVGHRLLDHRDGLGAVAAEPPLRADHGQRQAADALPAGMAQEPQRRASRTARARTCSRP